MDIILLVLGLLGVAIGGYYVVCHIIKLWFGCNDKDASTRLHNFINGTVQYTFDNDIGFANAVSENVKSVIGDNRYEKLIKLSNTAIATSLLSFGENSGLQYIAISMYHQDDTEKQVLENVLTNLVKMYLRIYGYNGEDLLVNWKIRYDLNMPFLEIRYARTQAEKRILAIGLQNNQQIEISKNSAVIDDTEEDLDD